MWRRVSSRKQSLFTRLKAFWKSTKSAHLCSAEIPGAEAMFLAACMMADSAVHKKWDTYEVVNYALGKSSLASPNLITHE